VGYVWDIFVSYEHDSEMGSWVPDHLVPYMQSFVSNALNRPVSIFVDREGIKTGQSWPLVLQGALGRARCLVPVWNPLYFHSDWCRRECAVMLHRERRMAYRTLNNPDGLVIPVNVFDGEFFPQAVQPIQWFDFQEFWIAGSGFRASLLYVDFQIHMKEFAKEVATAVSGAPEWQPSFLEAESFDVDTSELAPPSSTNFAFSGLE
jgi:hypothetical protein